MNKFCEEHGFCGWFKTSAKENINIDSSMMFLAKKMVDNIHTAEKDDDAIIIHETLNDINIDHCKC